MEKTLMDLGWSNSFTQQHADFPDLTPHRIAEVHRDRMSCIGVEGAVTLVSPNIPAGELAVGDWILSDPEGRIVVRLERTSLLQRRAAGTDVATQLIAANVDTMFIVTSCNEDFNPARLERYLALAHEAGCYPVVVLTKSDLADDASRFESEAQGLDPMLTVLLVNAKDPDVVTALTAWCRPPQTAVFVGSSGVGKTTLTNQLTGGDAATGAIREDDGKGRHVTTGRTLRAMKNGGWIIDTPGMRALRLMETSEGIEQVFDDITELAAGCRFSDCGHDSEPSCAVRAAVEDGSLDPERLVRWRKLKTGEERNTETVAESRKRAKRFAKHVNRAVKNASKHKGRTI